ncbi:MAG: hypothetical protein QM780_16700 [Hyphomicrobium sp.]|uniref:hypothetical protein n=1 Tax=Hyphomicrobium sp. TaxID=82 RepID=UPI0039E71B6A
MSEMSKSEGFRFNGLSVFGWVLGGLSVLNLIHDLSPIKLYGLVKDWAEGYQSLVEKIGTFLFGWIDWRWVSIDRNEMHIIVLAILLGAATMRASRMVQIRGGVPPIAAFVGAMFGAFFVIILPVIIIAALLPEPWGFIGSAAYLPWAAYEFGFRNDEADEAVPASKDVRQEFLGIIAVFALLVALNYSISAMG